MLLTALYLIYLESTRVHTVNVGEARGTFPLLLAVSTLYSDFVDTIVQNSPILNFVITNLNDLTIGLTLLAATSTGKRVKTRPTYNY